MKSHILTPVAVLSTCCFLSSSAHAALFSEDFESYTPDAGLDTSGPWNQVAPGAGTATLFVRDDLTATPFGASNQYLEYDDNDATSGGSVRVQSPNFAEASGAVTTFVFDFYEPSAVSGGSLIVGYANEDADLNGAGQRLAVNLNDGAVTGLSTVAAAGSDTYSLDTAYRLYVIFNDTGSSVSYTGGSVAAGVADLWLEEIGGSLTYVGTKDASNSQTAAYRVGFRSFSSTIQQALFDNVFLYQGVALPGDLPAISETLPADDATAVLEDASLVATFDKGVVAGTGNITLKRTADDTTVEVFDVSNPAEVDISGNVVSVTPASLLASDTGYYVLIDAGALEDEIGEAFAGISATTDWNFTTGTSVTGAFADDDRITGRAEAGAEAPGYYSGGAGGRVGIGGATGARSDLNLVLSFTLPTLPVGSTLSAASLDFEITAYRNHSGADPALNVYLLDSADPSGTGTDFFYHGPADPNPDVEFVGATDLSEPTSAGQVSYADDEQDQRYQITGDALALLQSFYGGDHIPDQTTVYFRFNSDNLIIGSGTAQIGGTTFDRYFIDTDPAESALQIVAEGGAPSSAYDTWASSFVPNPGTTTDNPDFDPLTNLLEFAFGTDPNVSDAVPLVPDGSVNGVPIVQASGGGGGVTFDYLFVRRTDHGTSGSVDYTPQFSSDLDLWYDSSATPTFVASAGAGYEVVSVPYPALLPDGKKARFARMSIDEVP
ncbi:hypothetical protein HAHE_16590 [Haloferula helveola]|uniref:SbsA Ig-like domain-containing protein n=1 Tax=Haloferula helveola TaxID=490095 RepID=A0ABN6H2J0_9BACT|nr:hypothetical protein HAHE_16590 [Haloferula helveola]